MISKETFMGGAVEDSEEAVSLVNGSERVHVVDTNIVTVTFTLPDARTLKVGGPHFFLLRPFTMTGFPSPVKDNAGDTLVTLGTGGEGAVFYLIDNTTQAGVWVYKKTSIGS